MTRGIVYLCWGAQRVRGLENRNALAELLYSVVAARRTGLPTCLFLDRDDQRVDESLFSQVRRIDFRARETSGSNVFNRKTFSILNTPFDETLFLDSDTAILDTNLSFAFAKLRRHGWCMAADGWAFGQLGADNVESYPNFKATILRLLSPATTYAPLYNAGAIFYSLADARVRRVMEMADQWCRMGYTHEGRSYTMDEQTALVIAIEKTRHSPFLLDRRIWNCRENRNGKPIYRGTKILHAWRSVKTYCIEQGITEAEFIVQAAERSIP